MVCSRVAAARVDDRFIETHRHDRRSDIEMNNHDVTNGVPTVGTAEFGDWATDVGHQFAARGGRAVERQLVALAQLARRHGVAAVSGSVLANSREPEVARARAFSRVVTALVNLTPVTVGSSVAAA
jgi:hypothetical protein